MPKFLHEAKELNILRLNCMKMKQVDTQSIVNTQLTYKDIIFGKNMGRMSEQNWRSRSDSRVYVLIKAKEMTREGHTSHIGQYS